MGQVCPTCGQSWERNTISTADELIAKIRNAPKSIDVYRSQHGTWHLTYTANVTVSRSAVEAAVAQKRLVQTYSNSTESFGLGPTFDVDATREARKKDKHAAIYLDNRLGR